MLSLRELRKTLKRENAAAKRNGDTLPDARARKMTRYVSGMAIETLEIPLSEEERQTQLDAILSRVGKSGESSQESRVCADSYMSDGFDFGTHFMSDGWSESINGLNEVQAPLPEPVPVSDSILPTILNNVILFRLGG